MSQAIDGAQAPAQVTPPDAVAGGNSILEGDGQAAGGPLLGGGQDIGGADAGNAQEQPKPNAGAVSGLAPLPDDASDDQRAEFDKKMRALAGVPQDANAYGDFGFGEEVKIDTGSADYKYYTELFHEAGISKTQAKKLLEGHHKFALEQVEHHKRTENDTISEYRAQVKRDFIKECGGEAVFKEFNDTAVRGFKASAQGAGLTDKDVSGLLSVMGDDPRFVKIFNAIGKMHREDVLITGAAPRAQEEGFEEKFKKMFNQGA